MTNDRIIKRIYFKSDLVLSSPMILGNGDDTNTDIDLARDGNGNIFIPATSIAGAIRHHLDNIFQKDTNKLGRKIENKLISDVFGNKEQDSKLSLVTYYDLFPKNKDQVIISIRDGIAIDRETGTTKKGSKFDYEIIEPGLVFDFKVEVLVRENSSSQAKIENLIYFIFSEMNNEKISIGAKTRRGFGSFKLENVKWLNLELPKDSQKWLNFKWSDVSTQYTLTDTQLINEIDKNSKNGYFEIKAEFKIPYSIIIRHYSENPADVDSVHLRSKGIPIIPGTTWNGALQSAVLNIIEELGLKEKSKNLTEELFGYTNRAKPNYYDKHRASRVCIKESTIIDSKSLKYTRNKIDRFTGGTRDHALFDNKPEYGGQVSLNISIKNSESWEVGLLLLALKDIGNGIQAIGGSKNIGRGILKLVENSIVVNAKNNNLDEYQAKLAKKLKEEIENV